MRANDQISKNYICKNHILKGNLNGTQRSITISETRQSDSILQKGPNAILFNMLDMARFGISRIELLSHEPGSATIPLVKTCVSYLLSHALIEEENVVLYHSQFGGASRYLYFTTERGFRFLRDHLSLATLAGTLGEIPKDL